MTAWNRLAVLSLYRTLLRRGDQLKYTNKEYYQRRIKDEFRKNKNIQDEEQKMFYLKKGLQFLEKNAII